MSSSTSSLLDSADATLWDIVTRGAGLRAVAIDRRNVAQCAAVFIWTDAEQNGMESITAIAKAIPDPQHARRNPN